MPKFSFLAKPQLFHLTDLNLWSCWTRQEDDGAGRVRGKSLRPRFWQGWARAGQQKTCSPCSCPKLRDILMPHPILSSGSRSNSHLLMDTWHAPVPVPSGLMDGNVPAGSVKLRPCRTNPHFSCSTQLQKARGKLHQARSTSKSQGFITKRRLLQIAPKGRVSA